jgi:hypothetical protein
MSWGSNQNQANRLSVPDHGVLQDIDLFNFARDEAALLITGSTSPVSAITSNYLLYSWASSNVDPMQFKIKIPRSAAFKVSKKAATMNLPFLNFQFNAALRSGGTTDAPQARCFAILRSPTGAQKGTFTPTSIDSDGSVLVSGKAAALPTGGSTNPVVRTWDFFETYGSGPTYAAPGDSLDLWLIPGTASTDAHTTDAIELHQAWLSIALNPAFTDLSIPRS